MHRVEKITGPFLVVVPLSTVEHWRREFEGWTDMVTCVYHDRQRQWRDVLREYEWYYEDKPRNPEFLKFSVLVTTYDTLIGDFDVIGQVITDFIGLSLLRSLGSLTRRLCGFLAVSSFLIRVTCIGQKNSKRVHLRFTFI